MSLFDFFKKKELETIAQLSKQVENLSQYQGIVDIDELIQQKQQEYERNEQTYLLKMSELDAQLSQLRQQYQDAYVIYQDLSAEISIYRDDLNLTEYGVYAPHFDFDSSEEYQSAIKRIRDEQKNCIKNGTAIVGGDNILWNNSASQGQAMVKRQKKLMMRAFNGECDSFIANVSWNNIERMENRIFKSFEAINKTYATQGIMITEKYMKLKTQELQLCYEYKQRKQEEKEEQRNLREQMREEERAARDFESARLKAEREESNYQRALERARQQLESTHGQKQQEMQDKIAELEAKLKEASESKQRALSMAQQTKNGHVYVISNIGSFGENVYKIGMTRRLNPYDRVVELGDASVPFRFDVHAMIFSLDAPALENKLHQAFAKRRVNLVNQRKEFFQVSLEEIATVVEENFGTIEFTKIAEAAEFRSSYATKLKEYEDYQLLLEGRTPQASEAFPHAI